MLETLRSFDLASMLLAGPENHTEAVSVKRISKQEHELGVAKQALQPAYEPEFMRNIKETALVMNYQSSLERDRQLKENWWNWFRHWIFQDMVDLVHAIFVGMPWASFRLLDDILNAVNALRMISIWMGFLETMAISAVAHTCTRRKWNKFRGKAEMTEKRTCGLVTHRVQDSASRTVTHWHPKRLRYY